MEEHGVGWKFLVPLPHLRNMTGSKSFIFIDFIDISVHVYMFVQLCSKSTKVLLKVPELSTVNLLPPRVPNATPKKYGLKSLFTIGFPQRPASTPWNFNIAPGNGWLEDEFPFGIPYFQGLC